MTEAEWSACDSATTLAACMGEMTCPRKLRLFHCASARRIWNFLEDERSRRAVEVAERHCEGLADDVELAAAHLLAEQAFDDARRTAERLFLVPWLSKRAASRFFAAQSAACASAVAMATFGATWTAEKSVEARASWWDRDITGRSRSRERRQQAGVFRDIFRYPFRTGRTDPECRSALVVSLANAAYQQRKMPAGELEPERLAVLADALEEEGVRGDLLDHLRDPGPHVRGCWAVSVCLSNQMEVRFEGLVSR